jgi:hypothetical protein
MTGRGRSRSIWLLCGVVAAGLAGCSSSGGGSSASSSSGSAPKTTSAMLLTVADLPAGWQATAVGPLTADEGSIDCLPRHLVTSAPSMVEADFRGPQGDQLDEIVSEPGTQAAQTMIGAGLTAQKDVGCATWKLSGPTLAAYTAGTATALSMPTLGDGSWADHWKATIGPQSGDFVLIRKNGTVALLTHLDNGQVNSAVTRQIATSAAAKVS